MNLVAGDCWLTRACVNLVHDAQPPSGAVTARSYRLVFRGELGDRFAVLFEGMQMERLEGTTVLTGDVVDQARLSSLISQIQELGLELVSVDQTEQRAANRERDCCMGPRSSARSTGVRGSSPGTSPHSI